MGERMQSGILLIVQTAPQAKAYSPILTHTHCRCIHSNHSVYTMLHCQPPVNPISRSFSWPTVRNQNDFRSSFYMALERVGCIDLSNPPIIHEEGRYVALFIFFGFLLAAVFYSFRSCFDITSQM